ncbi:MAG: class I SAM-dependent rRNA methyltransferase [Marinirhabdus sp.]
MFTVRFPDTDPQRLAVKLSVKGERAVRKNHPWVFSDSIARISKEGSAGDLAIIFSRSKNAVMGVGLFDPHSPIRIKMLHWGSGAKINSAFFREKIRRAFGLRSGLLQTKTNSYRLLFGENDGFPGLIADVYAHVLVLKLYSEIWLPYLGAITQILTKTTACTVAVLRLNRKLQQSQSLPVTEGQVIFGTLKNETVPFLEHGVHFLANVVKGHKTGYFLDHRSNRKKVAEFSKGKTVLDVFSYVGGFSVHALVGGAKRATSIDVSAQALKMAKENAALNTHTGTHSTIAGNAFTEMEQLVSDRKTFDVVVIDPPAFAKRKKEMDNAAKKYAQLAQLGAKLTTTGGVLVLASCSSRMPAAVFFDINTEALTKTGRKFKRVEATHHDVDHPVTFPEGAYLKCGYYRMG